MNHQECINQLSQIKQSIGSAAEEFTVVLSVNDEHICTASRDRDVSPCDPETSSDLIPRFMFQNWQVAYEILSGQRDYSQAFLNGEIRSNGYLTYLFPLLAMFQPNLSKEVPD